MSEQEVIQATGDLNLQEDTDIVNPWEVTSKNDEGIDYDKLISKSKKPTHFHHPLTFLISREIWLSKSRRWSHRKIRESHRQKSSSFYSTWNFFLASGSPSDFEVEGRGQKVLFVHWERTILRIYDFGTSGPIHFDKVIWGKNFVIFLVEIFLSYLFL